MATGSAQQALAPRAAGRVSRMTLDKVVAGPIEAPARINIYGVEKVGKTRFAAGAPNVIFLGAEDGTAQIDTRRFPMPEDMTLDDVYDAIATLVNEKHPFQTLAIDSLDWLEPIIWSSICARDNKKDIEDYGYGKGYVAALDEWRKVIAALETLRRKTAMTIITIAHSWVKSFKNPAGDDYERYEMKLHQKAARLWVEWSDFTGFMTYQVYVNEDERTKQTKGVSDGKRVIKTEHNAAWDAGNRYGLPKELVIERPDLGWTVYERARELARPRDAKDITAEILTLAARAGGNVEAKAMEGLQAAGTDQRNLTNLLVWLRSKAPAATATTEAAAEPVATAPAEPAKGEAVV